jgi:sirohydrochlorin ferrochelatase
VRKLFWTLIVAFLLPVAAAAQIRQPPNASKQRYDERADLQAQVYSTFMDRATERMRLAGSDRGRLETLMRENEYRRVALGRESSELYRQLGYALSVRGTPDAEFTRLLDRVTELRQRELDLWRAEQNALSSVLTPRQRAEFMGLRAEFFERVQALRFQKAQEP